MSIDITTISPSELADSPGVVESRKRIDSGRPLSRLALIIGATLFVGCADFAGMDEGYPDYFCSSKDDCPDDYLCILGTCSRSPSFDLDIEIIPTTTSDHLPFPVQSVDLDNPRALQILVPPPIQVKGSLMLDGAPYTGSARVSASAEATLRRIPRYTSEVVGDNGQSSTFEFKVTGSMLKKGRSEEIPYSITTLPVNHTNCCTDETKSCPVPMTVSGIRFARDTDDLLLAFPDNPTRVFGRIVDTHEALTPMSKVRVQAWSVGGEVNSLPVETDDDGFFCLALDLSRQDNKSAVIMRITPSGSGVILPVVELEVPIVPIDRGDDTDTLVIPLGDYGSPKILNATIVDQDNSPVEGASITISGQVISGGSYSTTTITDSEGSFSVSLLEGEYEIRVITPASSHAASTLIHHFTVNTSFDADGDARHFFRLDNRTNLSGRIQAPSGDSSALEGIEVVAIPEPVSSSTHTRNESFSTSTDDSGEFELVLDPGRYRLHFRPAYFSGLPWMVGPAIQIDTGTVLDLGSVTLEEPAHFQGQALGETKAGISVPLSGARIEVHARHGELTHLLWEGRADENGSFHVLIPRSLTGKVEATRTSPIIEYLHLPEKRDN